MIKVTPIPQEKLAESQIWRAWLDSIYRNFHGGVSGTFTTADSKTVTVTNGIITSIV